jgi:hypothetical protein
MEDQRFDAWARSLAGRVSRRTAMKAGIISALGGLVAVGSSAHSTEAAACSGLGARCTKDSTCCSGHCDTTSSTCACGTGSVMCNGSCVTACPAGQLLTGDCKCVCVSFSDACGSVCCGSSQTCCSSACTNTQTSTTNCGTCGHVCPSGPHATAVCTTGTCGTTCNSGFADCNGIAADGCETNIATDLNNCGTCGNVCGSNNATPTCTNGVCGLVCTPGFADCNKNPNDGCETPLTTIVNCGACGVTCTRANANVTCASGTCQIAGCTSGFGDCDGNPANGCETPLTTIVNCGACGNVCSFANATAICASGVCQLGGCNAGWADCNGIPTDGCETPLNTNANCGACGVVCGPTQTCSSGMCV